MKQLILLFLFFIALPLYAGTISIAVAANVSYAIEDLKKEFNNIYPDTKVRVTLGGSGKLTAQIKYGAPYQLFMSANMKYPNILYSEGIAVTKPIIYAQGSLAYFSVKKQDFTQGMQLLKSVKIKKIAVANPRTAPYGQATFEAFKNAKVFEDIKKKIVYAESISQTVSYAVTATDLGFIAKSSLYSSKMAMYKKGVNWADVDTKLYTPINQGIVILKYGENSSEVAAFYKFILGQKARKILNDYGYALP